MSVANTIYLTRKTNGTFCKYENCTAVSLTGQVTAYGSITGVAATDIVTITGLTCVDGMGITLTSLTGGAGLSTGVKYYLVNSSGSTAKLALSQGGTAINFTTNITAGTLLIQTDELMVWSSEFRDIFSGLGVQGAALAGSSGGTSYNATLGAPQGHGIYADPNQPITAGLISNGISFSGYLEGTPKGTVSDEVGHASLRQTFLARTHWKFTMSAGPSPLYATWADGDIIANNPPNT
jgi:hypothetical protein